jgi:hypothetical protein
VLYVRSGGDDRRRVIWVLIGLLVSAVGYAFIGTEFNTPKHLMAAYIILLTYTAFPIAVYYAITSARLKAKLGSISRSSLRSAWSISPPADSSRSHGWHSLWRRWRRC